MDFWDVHGVGFLLACVCFPRLTLLFGVATPFGPLAWIGWLFFPRLVIAILATNMYWDTNPVLCVLAWMNAFGGAAGATKAAASRRRRRD
jgi:hypothetical protein